jgi:hypothetical protein
LLCMIYFPLFTTCLLKGKINSESACPALFFWNSPRDYYKFYYCYYYAEEDDDVCNYSRLGSYDDDCTAPGAEYGLSIIMLLS